MPDLLPPPALAPIPFDDAAADAAIDACGAAASAIDRAADERRSAAAGARAEWRGPARDAFDVTLGRLEREAAALIADLRTTAGAIARARDANRAENAARAAARAAWARAQATGG
jgi:hypothetical protein